MRNPLPGQPKARPGKRESAYYYLLIITIIMSLYVFPISHNLFFEGGRRKTHILGEDGRTLCGKTLLGVVCDEVTPGWLGQPDPDGEVCKVCAGKARKILGVKKE